MSEEGQNERSSLKIEQVDFEADPKIIKGNCKEQEKEPGTINTLYKLSLQFWYILLVIIILILLSVMIGSISTPSWIYQGQNESKWRAGILNCGGCQGKWQNKYFSDILQDAKDFQILGWKETIQKLYLGGIIYTVLESCSILMGLFLVICLIFLLKESQAIGNKVIFTLIVLLIIFHSGAIVGWFVATEAAFSDCGNIPGYQSANLTLCASHGPKMAIAIEIVILLMSLLLVVIIKNRKNAINPTSKSLSKLNLS